MPEPSVICAYLADLAGALRLPRRQRARIMAESKEHLLDSARQALAAGTDPLAAQRVAIERFGPAPVVAAAFHRQAASATVQTSIVALTAASGLAIVAQAMGSPLFWHVGHGGLRPTGPWPLWVKEGVVLAADLRAAADVAALLGLVWAFAAWAGQRRRGSGPVWSSGLAGLGAACALGVGALAGLTEVIGATGFGPTGVRAAAIAMLLAATAGLAGGITVWAAFRLWAFRTGWVSSDGRTGDVRRVWTGLSPGVRSAARRALLVAVPAGLAVTFVAGLVEATGQGRLRGGADNPQIQVARDSSRSLGEGAAPGSVARGPKVDLASSLGLHITVFDGSGRVLASTALLDGRTPVPPGGVLSTAGHRDDLVTWQPRPDVRVAAVATRWSGPAGHGTIVVGRSLRLVEQRESRLLRHVVVWWLLAMLACLVAAVIAALWPPRPDVPIAAVAAN